MSRSREMKVAIATLGCKVNQYDSATIETALVAGGAALVPFAEGADVYVVNTCTVTDRADAESRRLVRRARRYNPQARVIVTGCFAQASPEKAAIPEVDHVVGIGRLADVLRAVRGEMARGERIAVGNLRKAQRVETLGAEVFTGQTRAFLKVQEGCDLFCTFCIVPLARGKSRSVEPRRVLAELAHLAERGFREVVLTGVHLGGYGADLRPRIGLVELLEMIAEIAPSPRVRLSSIDPPEVSTRLLECMAAAPVFCPHLHMPVQSGSDRVLAGMRRRYDTALLRDVVAEIERLLPAAGLGTDVIAGFPGETAEDFESGRRLLEDLPFSYFHVFPYSRRSGTTAAKAREQVPPREIERRAESLRALGAEKKRRFAARFVGCDLDVLIESTRDRQSGTLVGYSRNYLRVLVEGPDAWMNTELRCRAVERCGDRLCAVPIVSEPAGVGRA